MTRKLSVEQRALLDAIRADGFAVVDGGAFWDGGRLRRAPLSVFARGAGRDFRYATLAALAKRGLVRAVRNGAVTRWEPV